MVQTIRTSLSQEEKQRLADGLTPLLAGGNLKAITNSELRYPAYNEMTDHLVAYTAALYRDALSAQTRAAFAELKKGNANILLLDNMPEAAHAGRAIDPNKNAVMADLLSYMYAGVFSPASSRPMLLNAVVETEDDTLHQDTARAINTQMWWHYDVADYVSLQCLNTGSLNNARTLYIDFNDLVLSLPEKTRKTLASPLYALSPARQAVSLFLIESEELKKLIPNKEAYEAECRTLRRHFRERVLAAEEKRPFAKFDPVIVETETGWKTHETFADAHIFSSGLLPDLRMDFKTQAAKKALLSLQRISPQPTPASVEVEWHEGLHVIARQQDLYHRRRVPPGLEGSSEGRILNRARFFDHPLSTKLDHYHYKKDRSEPVSAQRALRTIEFCRELHEELAETQSTARPVAMRQQDIDLGIKVRQFFAGGGYQALRNEIFS